MTNDNDAAVPENPVPESGKTPGGAQTVPAVVAAPAQPTVDAVLHQWLIKSVLGQPIPNVDQLQVAWAAFGSGGGFTVQVQQNLAGLLNNAFSPSPRIVAANLPATLTVAQLKQNLHRSA